MVEIAVVAVVGIAALAAVLLAIKLIKVAARAVATVVLIGALAVVASTWGRPMLVDAWDNLTSYGSDRAPSLPKIPAVTKMTKQMEENQRIRNAINNEFRIQDQSSRSSDGVDQRIPRRSRARGIIRRSSSKSRVR